MSKSQTKRSKNRPRNEDSPSISGPFLGGLRRSVVTDHHSVYVVYLRNPEGDGRAGYYVGMTGLAPEQRFKNHKSGIKSARVVKRYGERLVPRLYEHLNPMPFDKAKHMEAALAESLRKRGYLVYGGH